MISLGLPLVLHSFDAGVNQRTVLVNHAFGLFDSPRQTNRPLQVLALISRDVQLLRSTDFKPTLSQILIGRWRTMRTFLFGGVHQIHSCDNVAAVGGVQLVSNHFLLLNNRRLGRTLD